MYGFFVWEDVGELWLSYVWSGVYVVYIEMDEGCIGIGIIVDFVVLEVYVDGFDMGSGYVG